MNLNWSLKKRFFVSFGIIGLLIILAGVFVYWEMSAIDSKVTYYKSLRKHKYNARRLQHKTTLIWQFLTDASLTRSRAVIEEEARPNYEQARSLIAKLKNHMIKPREKELLNKLQTDLENTWEKGGAMYEAYGRSQQRGNRLMEQFDSASSELLITSNKIVDLVQKQAKKTEDVIAYKVDEGRWTTVTAAVISFVFAMVLAYLLTNFVVDKIERFTDLFSDAAQGELGVEYPLEDVNCSEIIGCGEENCPEYGKTGVQCWFDVGSYAPEFGKEVHCPSIQKGKYDSCEECEPVYQRVCVNEIDTIGAWFNQFMKQLRLFGDKMDAAAEFDLQAQVLDRELPGDLGETSRNMISSMRKLADQAQLIADGDLGNRALSEKLPGDLGQSFRKMVQNLKNFVRQVHETVNTVDGVSSEVDAAANELNKASQELSSGAEQQSSSLQETSSSVEEIASMVDQSSDNASRSEKLSEEAEKAAREGRRRIDEMAETMEQINEDSEQISEAIEMIDDIAFQTNLLALNAAVEAANAGEHGAGFAVVADEVRQLAQRSSEAADEISEVIEESTQRTEEGTRKAERSREVLDEINEKFEQVTGLIKEVAAASEEQANGIEEINRAITELETITEENTANAEETASSSDELASQSGNLKDAVKRLEEVASKFNID